MSLRLSFILGAALCWAALAIAYFYMERYLLLTPCPLCILDRIVVAAMGLIFIALAIVRNKRYKIWLLMANALALALGFVFAIRHIWRQNRPAAETSECLSDSETAQTLIEVIRRAFDADGDCGAIYWEFAGLSIPEQVLLMFIFFAIMITAQWRAVRRHD